MADFTEYVNSLENILESINNENPSAIILSGDFNARSPLFWEGDNGNREGEIFSQLLISHNFEELINEPTHIREYESQTCIDLICTDQSFLFADWGIPLILAQSTILSTGVKTVSLPTTDAFETTIKPMVRLFGKSF